MKTILSVIIAACFMMACSKNGQVSPNVFGTWELRRMYGGFSYRDSAYKAGKGTAYQFNSDSTFKHFTKNKLDDQGKFHIRRLNNSGYTELRLLTNDDPGGQLISLNG